mmetsp:Transcript_15231/g.39223  ORF Transcript_15231/g.39223 Transcript_15231/m.39223 type:complete len:234 (-) Transcript_15231:171-872(-)
MPCPPPATAPRPSCCATPRPPARQWRGGGGGGGGEHRCGGLGVGANPRRSAQRACCSMAWTQSAFLARLMASSDTRSSLPCFTSQSFICGMVMLRMSGTGEPMLGCSRPASATAGRARTGPGGLEHSHKGGPIPPSKELQHEHPQPPRHPEHSAELIPVGQTRDAALQNCSQYICRNTLYPRCILTGCRNFPSAQGGRSQRRTRGAYPRCGYGKRCTRPRPKCRPSHHAPSMP